MKAMLLGRPRPAEEGPLEAVELPTPEPHCDEILVRVGRENLCARAEFTGLHVNGGYAGFAVALAEYAVKGRGCL